VLLVNDVVTTGAGIAALRDLVVESGGSPVGAAWFLTRGAEPADVGVPAFCIAALDLPAWPKDKCYLCGEGLAIEDATDLN
jgi:orotate phosphoribosyltransferase